MTYSLSATKWQAPSVSEILCNIDRIYAAGLFWRVVSPQLLERQSRLMSTIALMTEKLKASLPPHDQLSQEGRHRRYVLRFNYLDAPFICSYRFLATSPHPQPTPDLLIVRHQRELRLYVESVRRAEKNSMLNLESTAENIALVYNQLTESLEFWEDAKFWFGMPWWRKPRLDFPWAPPMPRSETLDPPERPLLAVSNVSHRMVTFGEGAKDSSPTVPALTRVPRCSSTANSVPSAVRAFRPRVRPLISV